MANTLTAGDPRYAKMFDVTREAPEGSGHVVGDLGDRLNSPCLMAEDVEVGDIVIPGRARVDLCAGSANRDPARSDNPDRYDITRKPKHHVGFGLHQRGMTHVNVHLRPKAAR